MPKQNDMDMFKENIKRADTSRIAFPVLIALGLSHCFNDLLQSVVSAVYPILKDDLALTFSEIGLITLVYQLASSVFQPVVGLVFDKHPLSWCLPFGMCFSTAGLVMLSQAGNFLMVLMAVAFVGIGSSVLHPEASRITSLASGGRRGLAQSLFQVGGNFGTSVGPLLVALIVALTAWAMWRGLWLFRCLPLWLWCPSAAGTAPI